MNVMGVLRDDALRVYLYLVYHAQKHPALPLTHDAIANATMLHRERIGRSLQTLMTAGLTTFQDDAWLVNQVPVILIESDDEVTRLVDENNKLKRTIDSLRAGDGSVVADNINSEQEASVLRLAAEIMHRDLTNEEYYYMGQLIQGFGPQRVAWALNKKLSSKEPLRAAYAMLTRGAYGKPAKQKQLMIQEVSYNALD